MITGKFLARFALTSVVAFLLALVWVNAEIPASPADWLGCVAVNLSFLFGFLYGWYVIDKIDELS